MPEDININLIVYDFIRREVKALVDCGVVKEKLAINFLASGLPAGVYFFKLKADRIVETKKMIVCR